MSVRLLAWLSATAATAVLLAALGWGLAHPAQPALASLVGAAAPDFAIHSLEGPEVRLSDLRGTPVVLNFWASWCAPCRQEEAALRQSAAARAGSVRFLGVNIQDSDQAARSAQARAAYPYPVGPPAGSLPGGYGLSSPPTTFFLDARGVVVARFLGPLDPALIDRYLELAGGAPR